MKIVFSILMVLSLFFRAYNFNADPPLDPKQGQSLSTDPPQYVHYAANKATFGSWDNESRIKYVWHRYNLYAPIAYVVFLLFDPGLVQGNAIGVFFNILTVLLLFWLLRYRFGMLFALFGMFFLAINFEFIKIGRLSYLENIQMPVLILAIGLIDRMDKWKFAIFLSGFVTAIGIFFCKASHLIPGIGLMLSMLIYDVYFRRSGLKKAVVSQLKFIGGVIPVGLFWLFFAYFPTVNAVWDGTVSTAFFSTLSGLESVKSFVIYFFTLFLFNKFSLHSPILILLSILFVIALFFKFYNRKLTIRPLEVIIPICLIFLYGGTCFWEYRPIRYQVVMIPLLSAAAVGFLYYLYKGETLIKIRMKKHFPVLIAGLLLLSIFFVSIIGSYYFYYDRQNYNFWSILFKSVILAAIMLFATIYLYFKKPETKTGKTRDNFRFITTAIIGMAISFLINISLHYDYLSSPRYSIQISAQSVDMILGEKGYLIGTYAPLLTVDAGIRSDTPIWGPHRVPEIHKRFPATHVIQTRNGPLMRILEEDYPGIRDRSLFLGYLYVRGFYLELWKLPEEFSKYSREYVPSDFEIARLLIHQGEYDRALSILMNQRNLFGNLPILNRVIQETRTRLSRQKGS